MFLKVMALSFLLLTQWVHAQAPSALLHQIDKDEIFRTFEIKPFDFNPTILEGKNIEEARLIMVEETVSNGGENLLALSRYAGLPMSFWRSEMYDVRTKAMIMMGRFQDVNAFFSQEFKDSVNVVIKEMLEIFIKRPYVDLYFDNVELVKKVRELEAANIAKRPSPSSEATTDETSEEGLFGISAATPTNLSLLALVLALVGLAKSFSASSTSTRERRR